MPFAFSWHFTSWIISDECDDLTNNPQTHLDRDRTNTNLIYKSFLYL